MQRLGYQKQRNVVLADHSVITKTADDRRWKARTLCVNVVDEKGIREVSLRFLVDRGQQGLRVFELLSAGDDSVDQFSCVRFAVPE